MILRRAPALLPMLLAIALMLLARPAHALIPGIQGPMQQLAQLLPQVLPFLGMALAGLFSQQAWRTRMRALFNRSRTPRGAAVLCSSAVLLAVVGMRVGRSTGAYYAAPGAQSNGAWPMFRLNALRTGSAGEGPDAPNLLWTFHDRTAAALDFSSSPAVAGDRIYIGAGQATVFDNSGMIYCLDAASGKRIWQSPTDRQVFSSPAVYGGRVYVGEGLHSDTNCSVYCLDAATGRRIWRVRTHSHTESSPAVSAGRVFIGAGEDGAYCLDAATGRQIWHLKGRHIDVAPAVANGRVYLGTGYGRFAAIAVDAATGAIVWERPCNYPVWGDPAVQGTHVWYGFGNGDYTHSEKNPGGGVWCLEAVSGKEVWKRPLPDAVVASIAISSSGVFAACRDGAVRGFAPDSGKPLWSVPGKSPIVASLALDSHRIYAADSAGGLAAIDAATGKLLWRSPITKSPSEKLYCSPAAANGRLWIGSTSEAIYCLGR